MYDLTPFAINFAPSLIGYSSTVKTAIFKFLNLNMGTSKNPYIFPVSNTV